MEEVVKKKKNKIIKKISDIIFFVFIALLIVAIILSIISKKNGKQYFTYSFLWVLTDSMEPTINENSYILVKKFSGESLAVGDIITFVSKDNAIKGEFNTHRIFEIVEENKEYITKGDNSIYPDELHVFSDEIVYKFVCNLSFLTFFGRIFSSKMGFLSTICLILILIIIYSIISLNGLKKETYKKNKQKEIDRLVAEEVAKLEELNNNSNKNI